MQCVSVLQCHSVSVLQCVSALLCMCECVAMCKCVVHSHDEGMQCVSVTHSHACQAWFVLLLMNDNKTVHHSSWIMHSVTCFPYRESDEVNLDD